MALSGILMILMVLALDFCDPGKDSCDSNDLAWDLNDFERDS